MSLDYSRPFLSTQQLLDRFHLAFGSEELLQDAFKRILWPSGFVCRKCRCMDFFQVSTRNLMECKRCGTQQSLTAGTPLHRSKAHLGIWAHVLLVHTHPHLATVEEVARHYKVSPSQAHRWANKLEKPDKDTKRLISRFLEHLYRRL